MPDPYEPGWRPEYTGDDSLGDVGADFGAELYELYRAGRALFPQAAYEYLLLAQRVHRTGPAARYLLAEGRTPHPAHTTLLDLREVLQDVLGKSSVHISEAGAALVEIADAYAATDEATADEFARLVEDDDDYGRHYDRRPPHVSAPPAPGDPQPHPRAM